jgi:hypothetical protein
MKMYPGIRDACETCQDDDEDECAACLAYIKNEEARHQPRTLKTETALDAVPLDLLNAGREKDDLLPEKDDE